MAVISTILPIALFLGVAIIAGLLYVQSFSPLTNLASGVECSQLGLTYNLDPSRTMMRYTASASFTRDGESRSLTVDYTVVVLNNICEGQAVIYGQMNNAEGDTSLLGILARFTLTNFQLPQAIPATSFYYILPVEAIESIGFNDSVSDTGSIVRPSYGLLNSAAQELSDGLKQHTSIKWRFDKDTGVLLELSITDAIVDANGVERQRIDIDIRHKSLYLLDNETQLYINPRPLTWSSSISLIIFGASIILAILTVINRVLM
ncbi:MAG: hypothetical protein F7C81_06650 [Desulfurococcales archaeon]|nr:hypothetical protein [Desulfurococcales archaeon]